MTKQHEGAGPTTDTPTQQAPTATVSIPDTTDRTVLNDWGPKSTPADRIPPATAYVYGLQDGFRAGYAAGREDARTRDDQYMTGYEDGRAAGWRAATRWVQWELGPSRKRARRLAVAARARRIRQANIVSCDTWRGVDGLTREEKREQYRQLIGSWAGP
jgi:hypothetical protein